MREIAFSVATNPAGKGRPRGSAGAPIMDKVTGAPKRNAAGQVMQRVKMVTPQATRYAEAEIRWVFTAAYPRFTPHTGPVELDVLATLAIPESWPKWQRAAAAKGLIPVVTKPDWDNIGKLVSDALEGFAYTGDAHVFDAHVRKVYGDAPRLLIRMRLFDEPTRADFEAAS